MQITLTAASRRVKKAIQQDLYWYCPYDKQIYHGVGSKLVFEYNSQYKMSFPKVVNDETKYVYENSYDDIVSWIKNSNFDINVINQIPYKSIVIDVNMSELNEIIEDLYNQKINYDYDEKELISEK